MKERIFISCVSGEFRTARQKVADVLTFLGYEAEKQEIFGTEPGDLRQVLRDKIDTCEGLIQIVGEAYGAEPPSIDPDFGRVSYTQFEFLYGRRRGKKTWLLFAGPDCHRDTPVDQLDFPWDPAVPDPAPWQGERRSLQAAYRDRLRADGHLYHPAANDAELENQILKIRNDLDALRDASRKQEQRVTRRLARILAGLLVLGVLGGGAFWWLKHGQETLQETITVRYADPEEIRAALTRGIDTWRTARQVEIDALPTWQERAKASEDADAEKVRRLASVDRALDNIQSARAGGEVDPISAEFQRILTNPAEGPEEALAYLRAQEESIQRQVNAATADEAEAVRRRRSALRNWLTGAAASAAEGRYGEASELYQRVVKADAAWTEARQQLWAFLVFSQGPHVESHGTVEQARASYLESERHALRLTEDDPGNTEWQRDLAVSHSRLGDVAVAQGNLPDAVRRYGAALAIMEKLAASDPTNAVWQDDVEKCRRRVAEVREKIGK
jgi:uncharacterized protein DUF4062